MPFVIVHGDIYPMVDFGSKITKQIQDYTIVSSWKDPYVVAYDKIT